MNEIENVIFFEDVDTSKECAGHGDHLRARHRGTVDTVAILS